MATSVKIKGRKVFCDGKHVATIAGCRHAPSATSTVRVVCVTGTIFDNFGYARDAQQFCRNHPDKLIQQ